jgi:hypothetical protein
VGDPCYGGQGVDHGVSDRGGDAEGAALADALGAEGVQGGRDRRNLCSSSTATSAALAMP